MHVGSLHAALQASGLLVSAGASAFILHTLLSYLPLCFTIGAAPAPCILLDMLLACPLLRQQCHATPEAVRVECPNTT